MRKTVFGFLTRSDKKRAVKPQKMAKGLKFRIRKKTECTIYVEKTKALISCAATMQLICAFVFNMKKGFILSYPAYQTVTVYLWIQSQGFCQCDEVPPPLSSNSCSPSSNRT